MKIVAIIVALLLGGCAAQAIDRLNKLDALLETEVDAVAGQIEDRRCSLPVDVIMRLTDDRGSDWLKGWKLQCPAATRLFTTE